MPTSTSSPPPSSSSDLEDIFHAPSFSSSTQPQHPSDSPRLRAIHATAGYRDGVSSARSAAVQGGFDEGYLLGAAIGARVGVLIGIVEGIVEGIVAAVSKGGSGHGNGTQGGVDGSGSDVEAKVRSLLQRMRRDLALENVLGPGFVATDGTWAWDVREDAVERGGVDAVAEEHPLIRKYAGVVGRWMRALDVRRLG